MQKDYIQFLKMRLKVNDKKIKNLINASKVSVLSAYKARQIIGRRKNCKNYRVPQIDCVRKKARTISIDARVANFDPKFMQEETSLVLRPQSFGPGTQLLRLSEHRPKYYL